MLFPQRQLFFFLVYRVLFFVGSYSPAAQLKKESSMCMLLNAMSERDRFQVAVHELLMHTTMLVIVVVLFFHLFVHSFGFIRIVVERRVHVSNHPTSVHEAGIGFIFHSIASHKRISSELQLPTRVVLKNPFVSHSFLLSSLISS